MNTFNAGWQFLNEVAAFQGKAQDLKPKQRKYNNLPDCKITGEIYSLPLAAVL